MQASLETLEAPVADPEGSTTSFNIGTLKLYVNGLPTNQKGAYFSANYTLENAEDATISPANGAASALIPAAEFDGSKQKLVLTQSGKTYAYTVRILDGAPKPTYPLDASTTLLWEEQGDKPSNRVGIVTFTNESNIAILKAAAGDRVTATATPRELSPYAYQFKDYKYGICRRIFSTETVCSIFSIKIICFRFFKGIKCRIKGPKSICDRSLSRTG